MQERISFVWGVRRLRDNEADREASDQIMSVYWVQTVVVSDDVRKSLFLYTCRPQLSPGTHATIEEPFTYYLAQKSSLGHSPALYDEVYSPQRQYKYNIGLHKAYNIIY